MRALVLLLSLSSLSGCWSLKYLGQQAGGQLHLLRERRRITEVLADPEVPQKTKAALTIAVQARDFGRKVLGLRGGDAYTRFIDLGDRPVAWNLTAAHKSKLALVTWTFPIVGRVPYLGFFKKEDAEREAKKLEAQGFDVYVRPVAGYSTLGYFAEPIFSSMLEGQPHHIADVVLHEMLHSTVYVPGQSAFNESLAMLVGVEGSALYFRTQGDSGSAEKVLFDAERDEERERIFSGVLRTLLDELAKIFDSDMTVEQKLEAREVAYVRAQAEYLRLLPRNPDDPPPSFTRRRLNNAIVMSYGVYHSETPRLRELLSRLGGDLPYLIALCKEALDRGVDPDVYVERLLRRKERPLD